MESSAVTDIVLLSFILIVFFKFKILDNPYTSDSTFNHKNGGNSERTPSIAISLRDYLSDFTILQNSQYLTPITRPTRENTSFAQVPFH